MAPRQHGMQAMRAKQRGEQWLFCNSCGARKHPITRLQMAYIPPQRTLQPLNAALVAILLGIILVWAVSYVL